MSAAIISGYLESHNGIILNTLKYILFGLPNILLLQMIRTLIRPLLDSNRQKIYIASSLRSFSLALVEVFIPIYLLNLGYTLESLLYFYLTRSVMHILLVLPVIKFGERFGFKKGYLLSLIPFFGYLISITMLADNTSSLLPLAILAESSIFYYMWMHLSLTRYTEKGSRNSQVVMLHTLSGLLGMIAPFLGGLVLDYLNIGAVMTVSLVLLLMSALSGLTLPEENNSFSMKSFLGDARRVPFREILVFGAHGIDNMFSVLIWPVVAYFLFLNSYTLLGAAVSLISLTSILAGHIASSWFDKNERLGLRIGSTALAIIWFVRAQFVTSAFGVFITNAFEGIMDKLTGVSFNSMSYENASRYSPVNYIALREAFIHLGRIFLYLALIFFVGDWVDILPFASVSNFMYFLF